MEKRVELLAPAGNYQGFIGAVNAGADAVYLGGEKFGARAYADNFTKEEVCKAIRYAHIFGRKVYLTVNTLVKESEFSLLYEYLSPFYEAGLDGVIIQDLGVWSYIRETFPDMALHASTQMTVTGKMGAMFLKEIGAARIVPARELSLEEIRNIKKKSRLEIECFIHGSMCYSYSGQCLFSSILGGRSGNRGRCAQPCRLPYKVACDEDGPESREYYPLSLKDLCTIEFIPALIEAGIDSFKIEGRMKRPEYTAGVTAIYRKYIDAYYRHGAGAYRVRKADMGQLRSLYIRTEIQTGYYERTNGREMLTMDDEPGYYNVDEALFQEIAEKYLQEEKVHPASMKGVFHTGQKAMLYIEDKKISVSTYGETVETAKKRPMEKEDVIKHLRKTGGSHIRITDEDITVDENIFMPVGQINELRRQAVTAFEDKLIEAHGLTLKRTCIMQDTLQNIPKKTKNLPKQQEAGIHPPQLHVLVRTSGQLEKVCQYTCDRIYIDSDYYIQENDYIGRCLEDFHVNEIFLALPYVIRDKDNFYFRRLHSLLGGKIKVKGFLVRNLESLFWVCSLPEEYETITDAGVYSFNAQALRFWNQYAMESYLPYELNGKECRRLMEGGGRLSMVVYGTLPMMLSANCLKKTDEGCPGDKKWLQRVFLIDRYNKEFPVLCNCKHCYNIIYNSVPYSLHTKRKEIGKMGLFAIRLDFVWESADEAADILDYYVGRRVLFPLGEYTTGHYKRGVE
ncbi:MAG: U32 family peptidase [Clostridium sp.]|nr:U32 family peptidase [Clostridium sp.]